VAVRLVSRYGPGILSRWAAIPSEDRERIPGTEVLWAEVRWAARFEGVVHLDDLLLRRTRLGLCLPEGGLPFLRRHRARLQAMLGWDEARWAWEVQRYRQIWETSYQPPR